MAVDPLLSTYLPLKGGGGITRHPKQDSPASFLGLKGVGCWGIVGFKVKWVLKYLVFFPLTGHLSIWFGAEISQLVSNWRGCLPSEFVRLSLCRRLAPAVEEAPFQVRGAPGLLAPGQD